MKEMGRVWTKNVENEGRNVCEEERQINKRMKINSKSNRKKKLISEEKWGKWKIQVDRMWRSIFSLKIQPHLK